MDLAKGCFVPSLKVLACLFACSDARHAPGLRHLGPAHLPAYLLPFAFSIPPPQERYKSLSSCLPNSSPPFLFPHSQLSLPAHVLPPLTLAHIYLATSPDVQKTNPPAHPLIFLPVQRQNDITFRPRCLVTIHHASVQHSPGPCRIRRQRCRRACHWCKSSGEEAYKRPRADAPLQKEGNATAVENNPVGKVCTAKLPAEPFFTTGSLDGNVKGYVSVASNDNGIGLVYTVKLSNLPKEGGPFRKCSLCPINLPPAGAVGKSLTEGSQPTTSTTRESRRTATAPRRLPTWIPSCEVRILSATLSFLRRARSAT